jgi:hypothetical protein
LALIPLSICFSAGSAWASSVQDVARAAEIVARVIELNQRFGGSSMELSAPTPIQGASGKYVLPIKGDGSLTGWAERALNAQVGNIAGEQAGKAATRGLASVVPGGGLAGGILKKKGKEVGALAALGGPEYIKSSSTHSFNDVQSYAVYLHATAGKSADYSKAVQAAMALYPDLEDAYVASVQAAYEAAAREAQAKKAAEDLQAAKAKAAAEAAAKAAEASPAPVAQ